MKKNTFLILFLALAGGAFLRFHALGEKTLWLDEINGIQGALTPWPGFWAAVRSGEHPPLFYLIHRFFLSFGENEFAARLPAAIFGTLSISAIFALGKNTLGRPAGLLAALLWAVSVVDISQSQNARNYTILVFLTILSLNFLVQAFSHKRRGSFWAWIGINTLLLYTHYFGLFVVSSEAVLLFFGLFRSRADSSRPADFRRLLLGVLVPGLLFLPWGCFAFLRQAKEAVSYFSYYLEPKSQSFLVLANYFAYGLWDTFTVRYPRSPLIILGILLAAGTAGKKRPEETSRTVPVFFPAIVLATVFSLAAVNIKVVTPRNLLIILPALYLLAARGILVLSGALLDRLAGDRGRKHEFAAALVLAIILLGRLNFTTLAQYYNDGFHMENHRGSWKQASSFLKENLRPGDRVLAVQLPGTSRFCLEYYLKRDGLPDRVEFTDDFKALKNYLDRGTPVYLLVPHEDAPPRDPVLLQIFKDHWVAARHYHLLDIYYLDRPFRTDPLPVAMSRVGKTATPTRLAAGDFIYSSGWFTMNVFQGRYTVNLFNGEFMAYYFFCQVPGSYSILADVRKEELWRETATIELILDEIPIASFPIEKSSRWVTGGSNSIYLTRGYHNLVLRVTGQSQIYRNLALSLSGITIVGGK